MMKNIIILFIVMFCMVSCTYYNFEENIINIENSNVNINSNDSTSNKKTNNNGKSTGSISFGVSDVTEG